MNIVGIGSDIVECLRIAKMIERHGERFICRVYTPREISYCSTKKFPSQHFAGYWAAKESVGKALGLVGGRGISLVDVEVQTSDSATQMVRLAGRFREQCEERGVSDIMLTIAHCRSHATAFAVAVSD